MSFSLFIFPPSMQYLLDFAPFKLKDSKGNLLPRTPYDVKTYSRHVKHHLKPHENLLTANLVHSLCLISLLVFTSVNLCYFLFSFLGCELPTFLHLNFVCSFLILTSFTFFFLYTTGNHSSLHGESSHCVRD